MIVLLANNFSVRKVKIDMMVLGKLLQQRSAMSDTLVAAEEIGSLAIRFLRTFDKVFRETSQNRVGCLIGNKKPSVDYNTMVNDLNTFYIDFTEPVEDCPINEFVGIGNPNGRARALVSENAVQKLDSIQKLEKLLDSEKRFTCRDCRKIGDAVIALEQSDDECLIHLDNSFNALCPILRHSTNRSNRQRRLTKDIQAARARM